MATVGGVGGGPGVEGAGGAGEGGAAGYGGGGPGNDDVEGLANGPSDCGRVLLGAPARPAMLRGKVDQQVNA